MKERERWGRERGEEEEGGVREKGEKGWMLNLELSFQREMEISRLEEKLFELEWLRERERVLLEEVREFGRAAQLLSSRLLVFFFRFFLFFFNFF